MARCAHCKTETELFEAGFAICINCSLTREAASKLPSDEQIRAKLFQDVIDAKARNDAAAKTFDKVMIQSSSGLPHPDGVQRIKNTSRKLALSRTELMIAHNR